MPKAEKIEAVKELKERFQKSDGALLAEFRGLKVGEMKELRRTLRQAGADFRVVKNSLTRLAVKEANLEGLLPLIEGSTAIAFVSGDPIGVAKGFDEVSKKYPALVIKGAWVEGMILDAIKAQELAKLKPREVLLAELAGMMTGSLNRLAVLLLAPLRSLGYALVSYREKVERGAPAAGPEAEAAPAEVAAEPAADVAAEPAPEGAADPAPEGAADPAGEAAPEPAAEAAPEPAPEAAPEPAAESVTEPAPEAEADSAPEQPEVAEEDRERSEEE